MVKKVVIAGSRQFNGYKFFYSQVDQCLSRIRQEYELIILSGHCTGVDRMAERYAEENGFQVEVFPAEWDKYGKSAGPRRNKTMVEAADFAIAFAGGGNGTKSLISLAKAKGIPVKIINIQE